MFESRRGRVGTAFVTLRQRWSTVGVTARQLEPLTCLASVVTGIEDHVQTLTLDP